MNSSIFWDITPCSLFKVNRRFGGTELATCFMLVSCLVYYSTLKMKVTCFSEMLDDFQRTRRTYIPKDRTIQ
jgi:hypothetical protein